MKTRIHIWVSGHVQGVAFRYYTRDLANKLGVTGWVKNLPDGRVEAVFEGDKEKVDKMIDFCSHGPSGAYVTDIKVQNEPFANEFSKFDIVF